MTRHVASWLALAGLLATTPALAEDPLAFLAGEDVAGAGGVFGNYRGLLEQFGPDRVYDTPISEEAIIGLAVGASATGCRPIVEIMYADFALVAADQLFNQAAKLRHMFGGKYPAPLVVRMRGTNAEEGRRILAESGLRVVIADNLQDAAEKVVQAAS